MRLFIQFIYALASFLFLPFLFTYVICLFSAFSFHPHTVFCHGLFIAVTGIYSVMVTVLCATTYSERYDAEQAEIALEAMRRRNKKF